MAHYIAAYSTKAHYIALYWNTVRVSTFVCERNNDQQTNFVISVCRVVSCGYNEISPTPHPYSLLRGYGQSEGIPGPDYRTLWARSHT